MHLFGFDFGLVVGGVDVVDGTHGAACELGRVGDGVQIGMGLGVVHDFEYLNIRLQFPSNTTHPIQVTPLIQLQQPLSNHPPSFGPCYPLLTAHSIIRHIITYSCFLQGTTIIIILGAILGNIIFCFYKIISMSFILCLAAVLLALPAAPCPTNHLISNLQTGSAFFSTSTRSKSNQITNALYEHTFTSNFNASPAVALSMHSLGVQAIVTQWAVAVDEVTTSKITIGFKHRPQEWTMVKAGFWATTRNDIHVGSVSSNLNSLRQSTAFLYPPIKPTMTNLNISIMRAFITGYTLKSGDQMSIRAFDKPLSANKIEIGVQVGGKMEISFVVVSYLIFSPQRADFASYGGGTNELGLTEGKLLNIQKIIHYSPYVFHGIAHIHQSLRTPMMILTEIDPNFYLKIDTLAQLQQVYISYVVIGIAPAKICSSCRQTMIWGSQCLDACPAGTYLIQYRNGGKGCRACPEDLNMVVNPGSNGCVCKSGYIQKKGYCLLNTMKTQPEQNENFFFEGFSELHPLNSQRVGLTKSAASVDKAGEDPKNKIVPTSYTGLTPTTTSKTTTNINSMSTNVASSQPMPNNAKIMPPSPISKISTPGNPEAGSTTQPATVRTPSSGLIKKTSDLTIRPMATATPPPQTVKNLPQTSSYGTNLAKPMPNPELNNLIRQESLLMKANQKSSNDVQLAGQKYDSRVVPTPTSPPPPQLVTGNSILNSDPSDSYQQPFEPINPTAANQNYYIPPKEQPNPLMEIMSSATKESKSNMGIKDCSMFANAVWTGYKCTCKVGYRMMSGLCVPLQSGNSSPARPSEFISKISSFYTLKTPGCSGDNQVWNGLQCVCVDGCSRSSGGKCIRDEFKYGNTEDYYIANSNEDPKQKICPLNSVLVGKQCSCLQGHTKIGNECRPDPMECGQNSYRNEGVCVCSSGYTNISNKCVRSSKCSQNSSPDRWGQCQCDNGYKMYGTLCQQCPPNQMMIAGQCSYTCGINEGFNPSTARCQCLEGYGLFRGVCRECPAQLFIHKGYCVDCPAKSALNQELGQCVCQQMYQRVDGDCVSRCGQNEIYSTETESCGCLPGLFRINRKCQICQGTYNPVSQQCTSGVECKENEVRSGSRCICKPGFGYSLSQVCIKCEGLPSSFLVDGYCVSCPFNTQNINGKCSCGNQQRLIDGNCVNGCKANQLMDENGYCYYCRIGQEIVNGVCVCQRGYDKVNGFCLIKCPGNTVQINGGCATCAFGMQYDRERKICACPLGYYARSNGGCQVYLPPPLPCTESYFYSTTTRKCQPCQSGCKSCSNANTCTECALEGFHISAGSCVPKCGDGIVAGQEACDDGNTFSTDGCSSSCQIQPGSNCIGTRPSRCTILQPICGDGIINGNEQCDDKNSVRGDGCDRCIVENGWRCVGNICTRIIQPPPAPKPIINQSSCPAGVNLKLVGEPIANQNNIFVSLQTPSSFKFSSSAEMRQFMKYQFTTPGTDPSSAYCIQRPTNHKIYECLVIYASGVPNKMFNINFSYKYAGQTGQVCVSINPFTSFIRTRSLK